MKKGRYARELAHPGRGITTEKLVRARTLYHKDNGEVIQRTETCAECAFRASPPLSHEGTMLTPPEDTCEFSTGYRRIEGEARGVCHLNPRHSSRAKKVEHGNMYR